MELSKLSQQEVAASGSSICRSRADSTDYGLNSSTVGRKGRRETEVNELERLIKLYINEHLLGK